MPKANAVDGRRNWNGLRAPERSCRRRRTRRSRAARAIADKMVPSIRTSPSRTASQNPKGQRRSDFPGSAILGLHAAQPRRHRKKAANSGAADEAGSLFKLHRDLLDELDLLAPKFKEARGTAAASFKAQDALEAGANFVTDGTIHDATAARMVAKMSRPSVNCFNGLASKLAHQIERSGYRSDISIHSSWSVLGPGRIQIVLGKDGADNSKR